MLYDQNDSYISQYDYWWNKEYESYEFSESDTFHVQKVENNENKLFYSFSFSIVIALIVLYACFVIGVIGFIAVYFYKKRKRRTTTGENNRGVVSMPIVASSRKILNINIFKVKKKQKSKP